MWSTSISLFYWKDKEKKSFFMFWWIVLGFHTTAPFCETPSCPEYGLPVIAVMTDIEMISQMLFLVQRDRITSFRKTGMKKEKPLIQHPTDPLSAQTELPIPQPLFDDRSMNLSEKEIIDLFEKMMVSLDCLPVVFCGTDWHQIWCCPQSVQVDVQCHWISLWSTKSERQCSSTDGYDGRLLLHAQHNRGLFPECFFKLIISDKWETLMPPTGYWSWACVFTFLVFPILDILPICIRYMK